MNPDTLSTGKGIVIVGSGMAGYTLARQLRQRDPGLPITLVTADGGEMYSKPRISNALAEGKSPAQLVRMDARAAAAKLNITVRPGISVTGIDPRAKRLETAAGRIGYGKLALALGADPVRLPLQDQAPEFVHSVNSLDDFRRWHAAIEPGQRVLLVGAGLIGCEFADDLLAHGVEVEMADPAPWPLGRLLPAALGREMASALEESGARLHLGATVAELRPNTEGVEALLDNGETLRVDRVLVSVGLVPRTELARAAGADVNRGIVVDRAQRTSLPDIYALGDCAETEAGVLPFVLPLMAQAKCLARVLTGEAATLALPAMPVVVKTRSLPAVVSPPAPGAEGAWKITGHGRDLKALYLGEGDSPLGFALTGEATSQWQGLARRMPPLLGE